jgi:hypothetical protein
VRRSARLSTLCLLLAFGLSGATAPVALAASPPVATDTPATSITTTSALLPGVVYPNGTPTTIEFQYAVFGETLRSTVPVTVGGGTSGVSVTANLSGLSAGTRYAWHLKAWNAAGTSNGTYHLFYTIGGPPPVPERSPQTTWAPVGFLPLSDARAAALVTHEPETRPSNASANDYVPTTAQLTAFHASTASYMNDPYRQYVTGRPGLAHPSTDDLVQWAAHKWGIPEDWIRAGMLFESHWYQTALGDLQSVSSSWYSLYPPQARIAGTLEAYESMGVMQVRWRADNSSLAAGTEPLRWQSTAFNLDFYGSTLRWMYNGLCPWCGTGYGPGQAWNTIGGWYGGGPWGGTADQWYIADVQDALHFRYWEDVGTWGT